jgi:hypothetical protein
MLVIDCEQRSPQWFAERLGKPSASRFGEILTPTGEVSKQRKGYMYDLVAQIISCQSPETYTSMAMEEGIRREEESRKLYEMVYGVDVRQVGMIFPDEQKKYLCSPDGLRDDNIGLELKNVLPKTQVEYLLNNKLPVIYKPQVQGSMLVTGFNQWHFMSYSPSLPPLVLEIDRDEAYIKKLEVELNAFNEELLGIVERLKQ